MSLAPNRLPKKALVIGLLFTGSLIFFLYLFFFPQGPKITKIIPEIAGPGDLVTISGSDLGDSPREGRLFLGGIEPPPSALKSWNKDKITLEIPKTFSGGLVSVRTNLGSSQVLHLAGRQDLPLVFQSSQAPGAPFLLTLSPAKIYPGQLLKITGGNLGLYGPGTQILFVLDYDPSSPTQDFQIESEPYSWTGTSFSVRVPSGSASGLIKVKTPNGISNGIPFTYMSQGVALGSWETRKITLTGSVSSLPSSKVLPIWAPGLMNTLYSNPQKISSQDEPLSVGWGGLEFQRFSKQPGEETGKLIQIWKVKTRNVTYDLSSAGYETTDEASTLFYKDNTRQEGPELKDLPGFRKILKDMGSYGDPLSRVKRAFNFSGKEAFGHPALVFTMMCRALGVPARLFGGFLIGDDQKTENHLWSEVFLPMVGWVPVDPKKGLLGAITSRYLPVFRGFPPGEILETFLGDSSKNLEQYPVIWHNEIQESTP